MRFDSPLRSRHFEGEIRLVRKEVLECALRLGPILRYIDVTSMLAFCHRESCLLLESPRCLTEGSRIGTCQWPSSFCSLRVSTLFRWLDPPSVLTIVHHIAVLFTPRQRADMVSLINKVLRWTPSFTAKVPSPLHSRCTNYVNGLEVPSHFSHSHENRCAKIPFYALSVFVVCTLLAQVVTTLRWEFSPLRFAVIPEDGIAGYMPSH